MPRTKTELKRAAGKLISAIQKEWGKETGELHAGFSEKVMDSAHDLLQADGAHSVKNLLGPLTIRQYIGDVWVQAHPSVASAISAFEEAYEKELKKERN